MNWRTLTAILSVVCTMCLALAAHAQGVESNPTGVDKMAPELNINSQPAHGWLGVVLGEPDTDKGVAVERILRDSPAKDAGLEAGDRILRIGDSTVHSVAGFQKMVRDHEPGDDTELTIERDGDEKTLDVTLKEAPDTQTLVEREFEDKSAPQFSARLVEDKKVSDETVELDDLEGKPAVIDFWASWCAPCRPVTQKLASLHEEVGDDAHFLGMSSESPEVIEAYLEKHPPKFPVAAAEESVMADYMVESYPTVFVLDGDGEVAGVFVGAGHHAEIRELVEELVGE